MFYNILCLKAKMSKYWNEITLKLNTYLYRSNDNLMINTDISKWKKRVWKKKKKSKKQFKTLNKHYK